jgi:Uma2 family endonuclease
MATATKTTASNDDQVVRLKISWSGYEALVENLGDHNHVRLTYDGETLEIMSPGTTHEFFATLIADMLAIVKLEWQLSLTGYGSTTFKTKPKGFEADKTFYLDVKDRVRDVWNIDIAVDPAPDLLVEIEITSSSTDKLPIYASLGVPEVWRYTPKGFAAFTLSDGHYVQIDVSRIISGLPLSEIASRLESAEPGDSFAFLSDWQHWLRHNHHLHEPA